MLLTIVNVYLPCSNNDKYLLWDKIAHIKLGETCEVWCVLGDFNMVRYANERKGIGSDRPIIGFW